MIPRPPKSSPLPHTTLLPSSPMLPGPFSPPMAQPLRGWSAPRGGARPSGGVLLELGVQRQHRDPSAPLLKGGKQKPLRCHRGFGELPPFTHGLSLSKLDRKSVV